MSSIWTVRRSAADHKVSGLCGGVAEHWGVDPVLVRVGAVLLALSGGIGIVLYLAGWLMIPIAGQARSALDDTFPRISGWPRDLRVALVAVACVLTCILLAWVLPFGFGSALILAAIWYFGYYRHRRPNSAELAESDPAIADHPNARQSVPNTYADRSGAGATPSYDYFTFSGTPTPFTEAARSWQRRMRAYESGSDFSGGSGFSSGSGLSSDHEAYLTAPDPVGLYQSAAGSATGSWSITPEATTLTRARPADRALSRPAKRLRLVSLVVLGLTLSGLGVASGLGAAVTPTTYLAAALLVAGLTLIAAAWVGRARGILPVALLLAIATVFSAVAGTGLDRPGIGIHHVRYSTAAELPPTENWDSGRLTVDLSELTLGQDTTFAAHVDRGSLTLIAPADTPVRIDSSVDDGYLRIDGTEGRWGSELEATTNFTGADPNGPVLTVHASVDSGSLEVRR